MLRAPVLQPPVVHLHQTAYTATKAKASHRETRSYHDDNDHYQARFFEIDSYCASARI